MVSAFCSAVPSFVSSSFAWCKRLPRTPLFSGCANCRSQSLRVIPVSAVHIIFCLVRDSSPRADFEAYCLRATTVTRMNVIISRGQSLGFSTVKLPISRAGDRGRRSRGAKKKTGLVPSVRLGIHAAAESRLIRPINIQPTIRRATDEGEARPIARK